MLKTTLGWCFILLCCVAEVGAQQVKENIPNKALKELKTFDALSFNLDTIFSKGVDSALFTVHQYALGCSFNDLRGNIGRNGSSSFSFLIDKRFNNSLKTGIDGWEAIKTMSEGDFFRSQIPITRLKFVAGSGNEQTLHFFHTQDLGENANLSIQYNTISNQGFYANQNTSNRDFIASLSASTPNKKFGFLAKVWSGRALQSENGGVADSAFLISKSNLPLLSQSINISDAKARFSNHGFDLHQFLKLNKESLTLHHRVLVQKNVFSYTSQTPKGNQNYFQNYFLDSLKTGDTTQYMGLNTTLSLQYQPKNADFKVEVYGGYRNRNSSYFGAAKNFENTFAGVNASVDLFPNGRLSTASEYTFSGYGKTGIRQEVAFNYSKNIVFNLIGFYYNEAQALLYQYAYGNHFKWDNNFSNEKRSGVKLSVKKSFFDIEAITQIQNGIVVFTGLDKPIQSVEIVSSSRATIGLTLDYKSLGFRTKTGFQSTNNAFLVRVPSVYTFSSLYWQHKFKAGWKLLLGSDFMYTTAYRSLGYNPALGIFTNTQSDFASGNWPKLDTYGIIQVKQTKIFVKLENALKPIFNRDFAYVWPYPQPGMLFRFGLEWNFYN